jgi:AcrR family transcriptional regulator
MAEAALEKPGQGADNERQARRREEILDGAVLLFAAHGYSETDTQLLADKLRVGKGTIYRYFRSKRELFLAAADRVMRRLRQAIDDSIEGIDEPFERIAVAVRAYLAFFAEHPEFVEMLIQERAQFKDRKQPTYFEHREANRGRWLDFYRSLIGAGRLRDIPVERISDVMSSVLYGTMFTNYFTNQRQSFEAQARDILDIVFNGILSESERQSQSRTAAERRDR